MGRTFESLSASRPGRRSRALQRSMAFTGGWCVRRSPTRFRRVGRRLGGSTKAEPAEGTRRADAGVRPSSAAQAAAHGSPDPRSAHVCYRSWRLRGSYNPCVSLFARNKLVSMAAASRRAGAVKDMRLSDARCAARLISLRRRNRPPPQPKPHRPQRSKALKQRGEKNARAVRRNSAEAFTPAAKVETPEAGRETLDFVFGNVWLPDQDSKLRLFG